MKKKSLSSDYFNKNGKELFDLAAAGDKEAEKERSRRAKNRKKKFLDRSKDASWQEKNRKEFCKEREQYFQKYHRQLIEYLNDKNKKTFFGNVKYTEQEFLFWCELCFGYWDEYVNVKLNFLNYGRVWQIDHIKPRQHKEFYYRSLSNRDAFLECFTLNNLRPTPKKYNKYKGAYWWVDKKWYFKNRRPKKDHWYADPKKIEAIHTCEVIFATYLSSKEGFTKLILSEENREDLTLLRNNFKNFFIKEGK